MAGDHDHTIYGPNALGGAINVVSRRPQSRLEGDLSVFSGSGELQRFLRSHNSNAGLASVHATVPICECSPGASRPRKWA